MDIRISIIMPIYNMGKYLSECLDSVIRQSLKEIEIIAINDGSTDNSLEILNNYASNNKNIIIITQKNQGQGMAKNNGINHAMGKYITFMDPDDFYPHNDCLESLYNAAEKNNVLISGGIRIENRNGKRTVFGEKTKEFYNNRIVQIGDYIDIYGHTRYIYNTELIKKNNILFPPYSRFEDQPFAMKALACAGMFYGLSKEVYEHRIGYKRVRYSLNTSIDILQGIKDVFVIAKEYNLIKIYNNRLKKIHKDYITSFYRYSFCGNPEIDKQIENINRIVIEWIGNDEDIILTKEKVDKLKEESRKEYDNIMNILCNHKMKLLYGAGVKTQSLINQYQDIIQNVIGIAVTQKGNELEDNINGFPIKQIDEYLPYKESICIIITTISEHQKEIEQHLNRLGFKYIIKPDMGKIELAEALHNENNC